MQIHGKPSTQAAWETEFGALSARQKMSPNQISLV